MKLNLSNPIDVKKAENYLCKLIEGKNNIELKKLIKPRSLSLNAYLHVVISLYAIHFGYTLEEAKTLLKRMCNFMVYEKKGIKFLKKTSKLKNDECSKFVDWIRNHSSKEGLYIPDPEEYKDNKFNIDKEIDNNKDFL